ncbi:MAG: ribosome recycling factor [Leptospiraceae bacterium]|nr:ribosome recycling factor [Leptospiraceae bacterium]MDW8306476.1 ribosome recycling factor [Leptospiraceae bacterium]
MDKNETIELIMSDCRERMGKSVQDLVHTLAQLRSGRATPALVEDIRVEAYGTVMPLNQLANISIPEARLIVIDVWDKANLQAVEKAIQKSGRNLNPHNDGNVIRISLPEMSLEARKEMVKVVRQKTEEHKVAIRNIRRDANEELRKLKGEGISEDEIKHYQEEVQKLTDQHIKKMDELAQAKEKEILTV